jgi:hypothetical protein
MTRGHEDAKEPLQVLLTEYGMEKGEPGKPGNCAISVDARREHGFIEFIVYRTISYGLMPGAGKYTRWQNSEGVLEVLSAYDINSTKKTKKRLPPGGITVIFWPPRRAMSTEHLNSDGHRKAVKASRARRKGVVIKRKYRITDPLTLQGVRWGTKQKT